MNPNWYPYVKIFHLLAIISWMSGIFYLPRIFVHYVEGQNAGEDVRRAFHALALLRPQVPEKIRRDCAEAIAHHGRFAPLRRRKRLRPFPREYYEE